MRRLARDIDQDYQDCSLTLVGILKGAFVFLADLAREMNTVISAVEFLRLSSYGAGSVSSGTARVTAGLPPQALLGQHVVLVEDIIDTGISTTAALRYLRRHRPNSLKVCCLLDKPSRRRVNVEISYLGFTVPDRFVVGYGLDLDQRYRQLPDLYTVGD